jgi:uncharacterized protein YndB with AHSA1/START domain
MTLGTVSTDRIEKEMVIKAPLSKVWGAVSNAEKFGNWFGCDLTGKTFEAGARVQGQFTIPGYEHKTFDVIIDRVDPQTYLSYRWHPCGSKQNIDRSAETRTLVEFKLSEVDGNTLLRVVESGFASLPAGRQDEAFCGNSKGWEFQLQNIARYAEAL